MGVANIYEPLGLAVNFKVNLELGVFNQWDDSQTIFGQTVLFKELGSIKV